MSITRITRIVNHIATSRFRITACAISQRSFSKVLKVHRVQLKTQVKVLQCFEKQKCSFHTSQRRDIPPYLALIVRPVIRIAALLFGRKFKKWYASKTPDEKEEFREWFRERKNYFIGK